MKNSLLIFPSYLPLHSHPIYWDHTKELGCQSLGSRPMQAQELFTLFFSGTTCRCLSVLFHFSRYLQEISEDTSLGLSLSLLDTRAPDKPVDAMKLFHRFCCWTQIQLSYHWAWLHRGYWSYRNLIDWSSVLVFNHYLSFLSSNSVVMKKKQTGHDWETNDHVRTSWLMAREMQDFKDWEIQVDLLSSVTIPGLCMVHSFKSSEPFTSRLQHVYWRTLLHMYYAYKPGAGLISVLHCCTAVRNLCMAMHLPKKCARKPQTYVNVT